jgi:hypothetical protein
MVSELSMMLKLWGKPMGVLLLARLVGSRPALRLYVSPFVPELLGGSLLFSAPLLLSALLLLLLLSGCSTQRSRLGKR